MLSAQTAMTTINMAAEAAVTMDTITEATVTTHRWVFEWLA